ncbi:MAG: hypothetical protein A2Y24_04810 [Clostridiales bacterium GWE2_32_10]|nr:MAG: hypothetical protein A2Y24_04810 [Clostridiales bacterium GWE2_32_10]HBY20303.1 hypothetical protein [Clostridiales bacterium]
MENKECLNLINKHFEVQSCIALLKNPDLKLKSHIFFFNNLFKEISEIKILRVKAKNQTDDIAFDIYYVKDEFEGLYHGYFRIKPETDAASKIFEDVSKMCTDLGEYMYYLYKNSDLLNIYLLSLDIQTAIEQSDTKDDHLEFDKIKKNMYREIAEYEQGELEGTILDRWMNRKYIYNFIMFNSKCSETVKMFLLNLLSNRYSNNICMINWSCNIKNYIYVSPNTVYFNGNNQISVFSLLDSVLSQKFVIFIKFDFDFEGGGNVGKTLSKR